MRTSAWEFIKHTVYPPKEGRTHIDDVLLEGTVGSLLVVGHLESDVRHDRLRSTRMRTYDEFVAFLLEPLAETELHSATG